MERSITIKVHGKILLIGGYSILYDDNIGISLSVDCAYNVNISKNNDHTMTIMNLNTNENNYIVNLYNVVNEFTNITGNNIIDACLYVLKNFFYANKIEFPGLTYEIKIDGRFYGLEKPINSIYEQNLNLLQKTGLGSSSCFIVSIIAGAYFYTFKKLRTFYLFEIYFLCIIANSIAQNKIGSNYDIFTCIFGSCKFIKMSSNIIHELLKEFEITGNIDVQYFMNSNTATTLNELKPFENCYIYLMDMCKGYDTVKSCKGILDYFEKNKEIKKKYCDFSNILSEKLFQLDQEELFKHNLQHRMMQQEISYDSGLPIEPIEYSAYLDLVMFQFKEELIYCICPGAGGYDGFVIWSKIPINNELEVFLKEINGNRFTENLENAQKYLYKHFSYINAQHKSSFQPNKNIKLRITKLSVNNSSGLELLQDKT